VRHLAWLLAVPWAAARVLLEATKEEMVVEQLPEEVSVEKGRLTGAAGARNQRKVVEYFGK